MDELFKHLHEAYLVAQDLKDLQGRTLSTQLGIVTNNADPMGLARVKATVSNLGARTETDWLYREIPCPKISLPVPQIGDTVVVVYTEGDPHNGRYQAVLQNNLNPASSPDSLVLAIGDGTLIISPSGLQYQLGGSSVSLTADSFSTVITDPLQPMLATTMIQTPTAIDFSGVHYFRINGKMVKRHTEDDLDELDEDPYNNPLPVPGGLP